MGQRFSVSGPTGVPPSADPGGVGDRSRRASHRGSSPWASLLVPRASPDR